MALHKGILTMQICSALSVALSFLVILAILRKRLHNKIFLKIILCISVCDFLSALSLVFGGTESRSVACYFQGTVANYFSLASFLWSAVIAYEVQLVVFHGTMLRDLRLASLFCWTLPLIATLLPLSTSVMENDDASPGWCFIEPGRAQPQWLDAFWNLLGFYLWLILVMLYFWCVVLAVSYKFFIQQRKVVVAARRVVFRIISYPLIVLVCWTANIFIEFGARVSLENPFPSDSLESVFFSYALPAAQGALTAIAFFATSEAAHASSSSERISAAKRRSQAGEDEESERESERENAESTTSAAEDEDAVFGADEEEFSSSSAAEAAAAARAVPSALAVFLSRIRKKNKHEVEFDIEGENERDRDREKEKEIATSVPFDEEALERMRGSVGHVELRQNNSNHHYRSSEAIVIPNPLLDPLSMASSLQTDPMDFERESCASSWTDIDRSYYE